MFGSLIYGSMIAGLVEVGARDVRLYSSPPLSCPPPSQSLKTTGLVCGRGGGVSLNPDRTLGGQVSGPDRRPVFSCPWRARCLAPHGQDPHGVKGVPA